jgi:hypothetical protein
MVQPLGQQLEVSVGPDADRDTVELLRRHDLHSLATISGAAVGEEVG